MSPQENKKPIYDQEVREIPTVTAEQQPTRLYALIRQLREDTLRTATLVKSHGQCLVNEWIGLERQVIRVVRNTVPEGEKLAPGIIYVGVAALAGPIFTHKRNFAVRWTSPLVFGALAAGYFLPGTAQVVVRNVWGRYGDPQSIDRAVAKWNEIKRKKDEFKIQLAENVQELRLLLQEGREFGKAKAGQKQSEAVQIAKHAIDEAKGAVKKLEDAMLEKASAAKQTVDGAVSVVDAKKQESASSPASSVAAETVSVVDKPKKQLPIGFKEKAEN
ncbi:hypothetical protein J3B02_001138 [Coemansia erecta]|uniref:MICOS complex subunit n=1 Tax=Coemansia asiatica TaxID=1052880 RepID=A0A9W7XK59_9FUNG|nr:hypothetical protein LPJ64_002139 [Coemansia asiatica]KAJ2857227.1 hypothetical protein J3B02_001138 [Coemansia erecta]